MDEFRIMCECGNIMYVECESGGEALVECPECGFSVIYNWEELSERESQEK